MKALNESLHRTLRDRIMVAQKAERSSRKQGRREEELKSRFMDVPRTYDGKEVEREKKSVRMDEE